MLRGHSLVCFISVVLLLCLNLLMVSSVAPQLLPRQIIAWILGIILFFIGRLIDPKNIGSARHIIFAVSCLLLLLPILFNGFVRGSRRWLDIGPLSLQPSEITKPWILLSLVNSSHFALILVPTIITLAQPDLGSAISIFFLSIPMIIYHPKFIRFLIIGTISFMIFSPLLWNFGLKEYQRHRILTFLSPELDPLGLGYNVIQSKIAIGSGGFFGKGYRKGTQGQLLFLPEKHTDFMFAATVEERGIIGAAILLLCYFGLIGSLFSKAFVSTNNRPLFLFTLGIAFQIWLLTFVNIGMNLGLLPVTGIPLPFLSVGGSSIISLLFSLGIVFSS